MAVEKACPNGEGHWLMRPVSAHRQLLLLEVSARRELHGGHVPHAGVGGTQPAAAAGELPCC